jgi:hypothetical protein
MHHHFSSCGEAGRRTFLADIGMGFTGLALSAMLHRDGIARADNIKRVESTTPRPQQPDGKPHFPSKAKSVIWIFLSGGYSHLETFDPKPALNKYAGMTFSETPFPDPKDNPFFKERFRSVGSDETRDVYQKIFPMQVGFKKRGESGIEVTDWWPQLSTCVDDIAFIRSIYTTDSNHNAENQMHHGRHRLDPLQPSIGTWVRYGLGTLNENLPQFVVLGGPTRADTTESFGSAYLGPQFSGIPLSSDPDKPLLYGSRATDVLPREQANQYKLIDKLNRLHSVEYPRDEKLRARIRAYELAFRMQTAVPEALAIAAETKETAGLYGLDQKQTRNAARKLLTARRLVERGTRFVQVYPQAYGKWDSHRALKANHARLAAEVDQPVAALLKDLKRTGLLNDTIVVFCTEFGRTPGVETRGGGTNGRDHHPHGFTVWMAGGGIKGGVVHGGTDELGFHAIDGGNYVTDVHATVLHLLGLDPHKLDVPGQQRLDIDRGSPIKNILV